MTARLEDEQFEAWKTHNSKNEEEKEEAEQED